MVRISAAAITEWLCAVEATYAKPLAGGNVSRDVVFNVLNADEQVHLALTGLNPSDVVVKEADWVAPEALPPRLVTVEIGQAGDAVPLQAMVQC